jgi:hypothetical protein
MTMCLLCRRNLLIGERFRVWTTPGTAGERPVCRLCEDVAEEAGWARLERPLEREKGSLIWHARKVA